MDDDESPVSRARYLMSPYNLREARRRICTGRRAACAAALIATALTAAMIFYLIIFR